MEGVGWSRSGFDPSSDIIVQVRMWRLRSIM